MSKSIVFFMVGLLCLGLAVLVYAVDNYAETAPTLVSLAAASFIASRLLSEDTRSVGSKFNLIVFLDVATIVSLGLGVIGLLSPALDELAPAGAAGMVLLIVDMVVRTIRGVERRNLSPLAGGSISALLGILLGSGVALALVLIVGYAVLKNLTLI